MALGEADGDVLGIKLGLWLGLFVGGVLGLWLGLFVGEVLGLALGDTLGLWLGLFVGLAEGAPVTCMQYGSMDPPLRQVCTRTPWFRFVLSVAPLLF